MLRALIAVQEARGKRQKTVKAIAYNSNQTKTNSLQMSRGKVQILYPLKALLSPKP